MGGCQRVHQIGQQLQIAVRRHYQDTKIPGTGAWELGSVSAETRSPGPGAGTEEMGSWARGSTFTCHLALFQINMKRDNGRYITPA